jgi:hypothetical protein
MGRGDVAITAGYQVDRTYVMRMLEGHESITERMSDFARLEDKANEVLRSKRSKVRVMCAYCPDSDRELYLVRLASHRFGTGTSMPPALLLETDQHRALKAELGIETEFVIMAFPLMR